MIANIVSGTVAVTLLGALAGACTLQSNEVGESDELVATTRAPLAAKVGATFEQVLSHNLPDWDKSTNVCEMVLRNVSPTAGAVISVADIVNGVVGANLDVNVTWHGEDARVDLYGKPKDRFAITGCNTVGDCELVVRLVTKGNDPNDFLGCLIQVDQPTIGHRGYSHGNRLQSSANAIPLVKAEARQKMLHNLAGTALAHQCTARVFTAADPQEMTATLDFWIDGVSTGPEEYQATTSVPLFPTPMPLSVMPGTASWGTDADSTRAKHIYPFRAGLAVSSWVWCEAMVELDSSDRVDQALLNENADPQDLTHPGMTFYTYAQPTP